MNSLRCAPGLDSRLNCFEATEILGYAVAFDPSEPETSVGFPSNAAHFMSRSVFMVLLMCSRAKVVPSIVLTILIPMINLMLRVVSGHVKERQPVSLPLELINLYQPVSMRGEVPSDVTDGGTRVFDKPMEDASFRIVVKNFAQALRGKIGLSHDALQLLIGQRPAGVDSTVRASSFYRVPA